MVSRTLHLFRIPHRQCLVSQECKCDHINDISRTPEPQLCTRLPLHLDRKQLEMRLPRCCMYAVILADTEFQAVGRENERRERTAAGSEDRAAVSVCNAGMTREMVSWGYAWRGAWLLSYSVI